MAGQSNYGNQTRRNDEDLGGSIELTSAPSSATAGSGTIHGFQKIPESVLQIILSYLSNPIVRNPYSTLVHPWSARTLSSFRASNRWTEKLVEAFLKNKTKLQSPTPWGIGPTRRRLLNFLDTKLREKARTEREEILDDQFRSRKFLAVWLIATLVLPVGIALCVVGSEKDSKVEFIIPGAILLAFCLLPAWMVAACCCISQECSDGEMYWADDEDIDPLPCINRKYCCPKPKIYKPTVSEIDRPNPEKLRNTVFLFRDLLADHHLPPEAGFQAGMTRLLQANIDDIKKLKQGKSIATVSVFQGAGATAGSTLDAPLLQDFDF